MLSNANTIPGTTLMDIKVVLHLQNNEHINETAAQQLIILQRQLESHNMLSPNQKGRRKSPVFKEMCNGICQERLLLGLNGR